MPDVVIVEDVTLSRFVHGKGIDLVFVVVGYDDFRWTPHRSCRCVAIKAESVLDHFLGSHPSDPAFIGAEITDIEST